jgi:hypothetical protein
MEGRFQYSSILRRLGNTLGRLMPSGAPPTGERTRMGTSTTTYNLKFYVIICQLPLCSLVLPAWFKGVAPPPPQVLPQVSGPSSTFLAGKEGQPSTPSCDQILLVSSSSILHNSRHIVRVFFWGKKGEKKSRKHYSTAFPRLKNIFLGYHL